jgi:hypothetical protein
VLAYLSVEGRQRFGKIVSALPAVWVSNEAPGVVATLYAPSRGLEDPASGAFILGRGRDRAVALTDPHGAWIAWLPE